ncbi:SDR family NAD(P)-dependent oxidoreductase [Paraburkholderia dilworthii]|uniref:SDR family NAD(P)-dependent oxidoreductase n=1 Tax=Paraburkholderia dilworthii TaxID=948106 RepID=UPI00042393B6|nr:SDR family NAD(P)-dependent oxidoreductase [Paraburkholderia dilworthii]
MNLKGKVAIVTGGGRGIGRAHALALARAEASVVVNDIGKEFSGEGKASAAPAEAVAAEILRDGGSAVANATDISDWDAVGGLVEATLAAFGRLDIVVNNAGITRGVPIAKATRKDWEQTIAVNLNGAAALTHWAAAYWAGQEPEAGRRIINTTSGMGLTPMPGDSAYSASKAALAMLTMCSAMELAPLGVRVNGVAPVARTRISESVAADLMKPVTAGFDRMSPDHVAALVAYLASSNCRFTGRMLGVIGDDVTLFDGWSVSRHLNNGEQDWSPDGLATALAELPLVQEGLTQGLKATMPYPFPPPSVLEALAAVEKA